MAINRSKVQALAQKYILKGQIDKAIKEYLLLLEDAPDDIKVCQRLGDLYARKGDKKNAREHYEKVAVCFTDQGLYLKAIAVYKQILRLDPGNPDLCMQLAGLYHRQGLPGEAMAHYRAVAARYEKEGKVQEALEIIRKMADLDPSNVMIRIKLAESFFKEGAKEKASEEIVKIGEELKRRGKIEDIVKLFEKFLAADRSNRVVLRELGGAYLEMGEDKKALENLKEALKTDPDDVNVLGTIVALYKKTGEKEKARSSLQHILRVDPTSIEARRDIAGFYLEEGESQKALSEYEMIIDLYLKDEFFDDALGVIGEMRGSFPDDVRVLGKLCEIYWIMKDEDNLVSSYKELARLYAGKGDQEKSCEIYKRVLDLRPDDEEAIQGESREKKGEAGEAPSEAPVEEGPLGIGEITKLLTEVDVYIKYGMEDKAEESLNTVLTHNPDNIDAHLRMKDLCLAAKRKEDAIRELFTVVGLYRNAGEDKKAAGFLQEILELEPGHKEAEEMYASLGVEEAEEVGILIEEETLPEIELEIEEEIIEEAAPEEVAVSPISVADIDEKIEEARYYLEQESYEKARVILDGVMEIDPENSAAGEMLEQIASIEGEEAELPPAGEKPAGVEEEFFDLTAELASEIGEAEEEGGELFGFDSLFKSFKEGIAEQVSAEDSETHYNLGIAYKEMGLYDEAMNEFMLTMKDSSKIFDAYSMLGLCCLDKGQPKDAIDYFKTGVQTEGITRDAEMNLNYELGLAYKQAGMTSKAREVLEKVYSEDKTYRDVEREFLSVGGMGGEANEEDIAGMETVSEKEIKKEDPRSKDKISYI